MLNNICPGSWRVTFLYPIFVSSFCNNQCIVFSIAFSVVWKWSAPGSRLLVTAAGTPTASSLRDCTPCSAQGCWALVGAKSFHCIYISVLLGQAAFSTRAGISPGYTVSLLLWVTFALLQQEGWQREEMGLIQQGDAVCFYPVLFEIVECSPGWHGSIHCLAVISHVEYSPKIRHMS